MPNCFELIRKSTNKPERFQTIDEEMCKHFNVKVHPTQWLWFWYDSIGLSIACGRTLQELISMGWNRLFFEDLHESELIWTNRQLQTCQWLDSNFTTHAWYQCH